MPACDSPWATFPSDDRGGLTSWTSRSGTMAGSYPPSSRLTISNFWILPEAVIGSASSTARRWGSL
jgi:hypothetical protein